MDEGEAANGVPRRRLASVVNPGLYDLSVTTYVLATGLSFWASIASSLVVAGVVFLVGAVVGPLYRSLRAPLFELRKIDDDRAILKYHGWFPIQLGENWEMGKGTVLSTPTRKGQLAGDCMGRAASKTVVFDRLRPGEGVTICFRRLIRSRGNMQDSGDCPAVISIQNNRRKFFEWKTYRLELSTGN